MSWLIISINLIFIGFTNNYVYILECYLSPRSDEEKKALDLENERLVWNKYKKKLSWEKNCRGWLNDTLAFFWTWIRG